VTLSGYAGTDERCQGSTQPAYLGAQFLDRFALGHRCRHGAAAGLTPSERSRSAAAAIAVLLFPQVDHDRDAVLGQQPLYVQHKHRGVVRRERRSCHGAHGVNESVRVTGRHGARAADPAAAGLRFRGVAVRRR
jgi:hypothetical protein